MSCKKPYNTHTLTVHSGNERLRVLPTSRSEPLTNRRPNRCIHALSFSSAISGANRGHFNAATGKGLVRKAENVAEAAEMMGHEDGGKALTATIDAYSKAANGDGADEFGKTVFPSKNFSADQPLCEY